MPIERSNSFHLLLSDDELKLLKLLAERDGLNASDYLRMLIRSMPSTSSQILQGMRLGAALGSKLDVARLFDAQPEPAKPGADEPKRRKAK